LAEAAELVLAHHERFDGTGYPKGLKGQDIPLGTRIFAVADAFEAFRSIEPWEWVIPRANYLAAGTRHSFWDARMTGTAA
jgi:response regulator RpfG family c-di-GMP phosphodiesterase